ncbi:hypothetical protein OH77DRAFT_1438660 [Trametes cingulata]|nr:hypothetical protein OH77DRAFT_1438660 [Trametes cingulata]
MSVGARSLNGLLTYEVLTSSPQAQEAAWQEATTPHIQESSNSHGNHTAYDWSEAHVLQQMMDPVKVDVGVQTEISQSNEEPEDESRNEEETEENEQGDADDEWCTGWEEPPTPVPSTLGKATLTSTPLKSWTKNTQPRSGWAHLTVLRGCLWDDLGSGKSTGQLWVEELLEAADGGVHIVRGSSIDSRVRSGKWGGATLGALASGRYRVRGKNPIGSSTWSVVVGREGGRSGRWVWRARMLEVGEAVSGMCALTLGNGGTTDKVDVEVWLGVSSPRGANAGKAVGGVSCDVEWGHGGQSQQTGQPYTQPRSRHTAYSASDHLTAQDRLPNGLHW